MSLSMPDIIIIGGSIIGSSIDIHMALEGEAESVIVVEPDPS